MDPVNSQVLSVPWGFKGEGTDDSGENESLKTWYYQFESKRKCIGECRESGTHSKLLCVCSLLNTWGADENLFMSCANGVAFSDNFYICRDKRPNTSFFFFWRARKFEKKTFSNILMDVIGMKRYVLVRIRSSPRWWKTQNENVIHI